jgi:hypothetical protein
MDLEKEETRDRVRGIGYRASLNNYAPWYLRRAFDQRMVESIDMILEKVIAIEAVGVYRGGWLTSPPHDTEILRGSTVATPSQTVRRAASIDGYTRQL